MEKQTLDIITTNQGVHFEGTIPLIVKKKERNWIAYSPQFKTFGYSSEGESQAIDDFGKALHIFLKVHTERQTLNKALTVLGWSKLKDSFEQPQYFNVPLNLLNGTKRDYKLREVIKW